MRPFACRATIRGRHRKVDGRARNCSQIARQRVLVTVAGRSRPRVRVYRRTTSSEIDKTQRNNLSRNLDRNIDAYAAVLPDILRRAEAVIHARYASDLAKCTSDALVVTSAVRKRGDEIDDRAQETRKASFSINWRREKLRREVAAFDSVRFRRYLQRIVHFYR